MHNENTALHKRNALIPPEISVSMLINQRQIQHLVHGFNIMEFDSFNKI